MERKLYEYDYEKPELTDEFFEHHGILGQRWGRKNGPPYPLDDDVSTGRRLKKKSKGSLSDRHKAKKLKKKRGKALKKARAVHAKNIEEQKKTAITKEQALKDKSGKVILQNIDKFTNKEIDDFLTRQQKEQALSEYVNKYSSSHRSRKQKVKGMIRENAGKAITEMSKLAVQNGTKMILKNSAKALRSGSADSEKWEQMVDQLFKEKKK